ncbi:hypothetical protein [Methylorubrum extorquens]|uniref:hypothetical protein n=1 Tax=Methylorubrum extorquens TaxID=408 RepID=UPI0020A180FC|nr:hypothetical protein [Methylorubrum extorquens]MCP1535702.1 RPA family protein [Methylorubrum extorquens]
MFDPKKLKTVSDAHRYMENARKHGRPDLVEAAFRRLCELEAGNRADPLVLDFWRVVAAVEELLRQKHGRIVRAQRTRTKAKEKGEIACLADWAMGAAETEGFKMLVEANLADHTGEYLVVKYAEKFSSEAVSAAQARLDHHGIQVK